MSVAWKIGRAIKPLSGHSSGAFSPDNAGSQRRPMRRRVAPQPSPSNVRHNDWVGVTIREVAESAQIRSTARFATFRCGDGYTTSHPLNVLYDSDVLLTYQWDGKPLPIEHGGPVRLLVPKRYAYKSAKWVRAVTFTDEEELGYWEVRGYSNTADPLTEDRYSF